MEEIAQGYLTKLIHRNLVQVSLLRNDGKVKHCRFHDLIRDMILKKNEDLNFCKHISDYGQSNFSGILRRVSVNAKLRTSPNDLNLHIQRSHVQSLFVFEDASGFLHFWRIPTKFRLFKVLDYECLQTFFPFHKVEILIHLKYLRLNCLGHIELPKSFGMLQNLETLEVRNAFSIHFPKEISKLKKLRHLISGKISLIEIKNGIGEMTSL